MMNNYLLFDIGGTKSRFAVSKSEGFAEPEIIDTPKDFDEAINKFSEVAKQICDGEIEKAAGGIAGPLNREKTGIINAPNLSDWNGKNFTKSFSEKINAKVFLENDTAIVGLGEALDGPGRDYSIVVYITISTGVNGVRIVDKKIDRNVFGFEIGSQIIDFDNSMKAGSSGLGDLEDFISGRETKKKYGKHPKEVKEQHVWKEIAEWASIGIYNTVLHWSPEIVILGGAMMNDIPVEVIEKNLEKLLKDVYPDTPKLVKAELGDIGGLHGALHYVKQL